MIYGGIRISYDVGNLAWIARSPDGREYIELERDGIALDKFEFAERAFRRLSRCACRVMAAKEMKRC